MIIRFLFIAMSAVLIGLTACGGGSDSSHSGGSGELVVDQSVTGSIGRIGEVDWYHFRAVETNNILEIQLTGPMRSEVEFMVGVHEEDDSAQKRRLYSDHSPEESQLAANVRMNVYVEEPKDLYISVRDLLDDESTDGTYTLNVRYVGAPDGNQNFSSAVPISVNGDSAALQDNIAYIGDVDCYSFNVAQSGVYGVNVFFTPFSGGTDVDLTVKLYDADGALIENRVGLAGNATQIRSYLSGPDATYYVVVEDSGKDDFDTSSYYQIGVETVPVEEAFSDDSRDQALELTLDAGSQTFQSGGALDYTSSSDGVDHSGDMDWYRMNIGSSEGAAAGLKISFDDSGDDNQAVYRILLEDETGAVLLSHDFAGSSAAYQNQIKAGSGSHYLVVAAPDDAVFAQSAAYNFNVEVVDIDDPAEDNGGNDTESNAIALSPGVTEQGKIAYRGDVDWYRLSVDTTSPQVLELFLNSEASAVEYAVELRLGDEIIKRQFDTAGMDGDTRLKTSILVPETPEGSATYHIRVGDLQNDDGDVLPYDLTVGLNPVPGSVAAASAGGTTHYFSEIEEQHQSEDVAVDLEVEIFSGNQPHFSANTDYLDFRDPTSGAIQTPGENGVVVIEMPWIAGFIDYQGDRDIFGIDLGPLNPAAPDAQFYYDIEVRLMSASETDVEYTWKFYRDRNGNSIVMDDPTSPDGYFACDGDPNPEENYAFDIVTASSAEENFWVGHSWAEEGARIYFGMQDFNYLQLPTGGANPLPDDDWGYDAPYYFKIILTYHPGESNP